MAEKMTRGQIQDLVGKFASENPKYRAALLSNPKGTIEKQLNTQLGAMTVKAVADTADTVHVIIPYAAAEGELSDSDLERVAGGNSGAVAPPYGVPAASAGDIDADPIAFTVFGWP